MLYLYWILSQKKELIQGNYLNPQAKIGPDILTRIHYAENLKGREDLRELIVRDLDNNIKILCKQAGADPKDIVNIAIAGNTAMTHLFFGDSTELDYKGALYPTAK